MPPSNRRRRLSRLCQTCRCAAGRSAGKIAPARPKRREAQGQRTNTRHPVGGTWQCRARESEHDGVYGSRHAGILELRSGKVVVNAFGLAQVAKDRAYMLWMIRDGTPMPLKLFTPDASGRALVANVGVRTSTTGITLLAVTEENASGAAAMMVTPGPSTRRAHRQRRCARRVEGPRVVWLDHETARLPEALRRYDGGYVTRPRG
ncbi:anti-sigma factor domain-containing protein [Gemmatimonas sp.]|uniref:anti-sigma factor domain-containing protein n=1 Tax=Gemmatimonas sp. TaxID=1962908 RepID=UPI003DA6900F